MAAQKSTSSVYRKKRSSSRPTASASLRRTSRQAPLTQSTSCSRPVARLDPGRRRPDAAPVERRDRLLPQLPERRDHRPERQLRFSPRRRPAAAPPPPPRGARRAARRARRRRQPAPACRCSAAGSARSGWRGCRRCLRRRSRGSRAPRCTVTAGQPPPYRRRAAVRSRRCRRPRPRAASPGGRRPATRGSSRRAPGRCS